MRWWRIRWRFVKEYLAYCWELLWSDITEEEERQIHKEAESAAREWLEKQEDKI